MIMEGYGQQDHTGIALVPGNNSWSPVAAWLMETFPSSTTNAVLPLKKDPRCGRAGSSLSLGCAAWVLLILKKPGGDQVGRHPDRRWRSAGDAFLGSGLSAGPSWRGRRRRLGGARIVG